MFPITAPTFPNIQPMDMAMPLKIKIKSSLQIVPGLRFARNNGSDANPALTEKPMEVFKNLPTRLSKFQSLNTPALDPKRFEMFIDT